MLCNSQTPISVFQVFRRYLAKVRLDLLMGYLTVCPNTEMIEVKIVKKGRQTTLHWLWRYVITTFSCTNVYSTLWGWGVLVMDSSSEKLQWRQMFTPYDFVGKSQIHHTHSVYDYIFMTRFQCGVTCPDTLSCRCLPGPSHVAASHTYISLSTEEWTNFPSSLLPDCKE